MVDDQKDFTELCALLSANAVDYVTVGGYALAFHGAPRYTNDLDLLVGPTDENASKLGRDAFLANKRAAGRAKDLADLHALRSRKPR